MLEFNVKEDILFPNYLWHAKINGVDNRELEKFVYTVQNQDPAGVSRSNVGGWHSHPYEEGDKPPDSFKELLHDITEFTNDFCFQKTGINDLYIGNYWFIINEPGSYNAPHHHMGSFLSCAYYIKVPENSGDITLEREDSAEYFLGNDIGKSPFTYINYRRRVEEGLLLVFPSWVKHGVSQNQSNENRIVLSINFCSKTKNVNEKIQVGRRT